MDWKAKLSDAKTLAEKARLRIEAGSRNARYVTEAARVAGTERVRGTIEDQWPRVQRLFTNAVQGPARVALYDDQLMHRILPVVYQELPAVIRVAVQQEEFVQFCLANRHRLLLPGEDS